MTQPVDEPTGPPPEDEEEAGPPSRKSRWRLVMFVGVVLVLLVLARTLNLTEYLERTRGFIEQLGPWGPIAFILIYVAATVAMIPAWPLTVLAGALFHWALGTLYVSLGATIGAAICFLIARYVARDVVAAWVQRRATFRKLNDLTDQHGAWVVAITRLVPIFPYNLINYAFGLTAVSFGTYVFWSWLCMLPGTALYVVGGAAGVSLLEGREIPWQLLGILAGVVVFVSVSTWYGRKQWLAAAARKRARRAEEAERRPEPDDPACEGEAT